MYIVEDGEKVRVRFCLFPLLPLLPHLVFLELIHSASAQGGCCMEPSQVRHSESPGSWVSGRRRLGSWTPRSEGEGVVVVH